MIAGIALAAVTLAAAAPQDLGVVFRSSAGSAGLVAACPRIAVVETSSGGADLARSFLATCPGSEAVFQLPDSVERPPASSVEDARFRAFLYWSSISAALTPLTATTSASERAAVWLGGPAALDSFPSWRDDPACAAGALFCAADYMGAFWAELDRLARTAGFRGLVLPPFSPRPGDRPDALCALFAGVERATAADVAWTWDAVSPGLSQTAGAESTSTFGYRELRATCAAARVHPLLVRASVAGGWQSRATPTGFMEWLRFLDREVDADPEPFLGVAVYGHGTADANDLAPVAAQLAAYLVDPSTPPDDGGGGSGGISPPGAPPTEPGSNLGPDRGASGGCSTGGGSLALVAFAPFALGRVRRSRVSARA